jgi:hypothetical protein
MFSLDSIDNIVNQAGKYYRILPRILSILYVLVFVGVIYINPEYLHIFKTTMQVFVCLFLIYRFHPYRNHVLGKYDAQIIFSSAIFLLVNVTAVDIANKFIKPLDNVLNISTIPIADLPITEVLEVM